MNGILELLLPDADEARLDLARSWSSYMRLLLDDARPQDAGRVGIDPSGAQSAFDEHAGRAADELLGELLLLHLRAHLDLCGRGGFLGGGPPPRAASEAWSALEEHRREWPWLAGVPEPGESALEVARRLLGSLERLRGGPAEVWRARLALAERGEAPVRKAERGLALRLREERAVARRCELLRASVELWLERGAVREASAALEEGGELVLQDDGLIEQRAWTFLLTGQVAEAQALLAARRPGPRGSTPGSCRARARGGALPEPLAELRERVPAWSHLLEGEPAAPSRRGALAPDCDGVRASYGAALFAVFRVSAAGTPEALRLEVSPGWRRRLDPWLRERDGVCSSPSRPEHRLVASAREQIEHRLPGQAALRGALGGDETLALCLWPIPDEGGEVTTWIHLELEHHLVPGRRRMEALALALASALPPAPATPGAALAHGFAEDVPGASAALADFFAGLVRELGMKTAQRRWWGIVRDGEREAVVATDGGTLDGWARRRGGARILRRAALSRGVVSFGRPEPSLSVSADSGSGFCAPFVLNGRAVGYLVVESERRRDFRPEDVERCARRVAERTSDLRVACFRAWHVERFGADACFDPGRRGFGRSALDLALAGRSSGPVVLAGPAGSGKEILARWIHHESDAVEEELRVLRLGAVDAGAVERALDELAASGDHGAGTLVLKDLEALEPRLQGRLLHALEAGLPPRPRLVLTTRCGLGEAARSGALLDGLAQRLDRLQLVVPPLCERRTEIPGLVAAFSRHFAAQAGIAEPEWEDEAVAVLWRQAWPGNVRQLENAVFKLVLLHPGERLGAEHVRQLAKRFRLELVRRLPSRHPSRGDLLAALDSTRKQSGNPNKTRAAMYLGWDPDTLCARLRDAGLLEGEASGGVEDPEPPPEPPDEV